MNEATTTTARMNVDKVLRIIEDKKLQETADRSYVVSVLKTQEKKDNLSILQMIKTIMDHFPEEDAKIANTLLAGALVGGIHHGDMQAALFMHLTDNVDEEIPLVEATEEEEKEFDFAMSVLNGKSINDREMFELLAEQENVSLFAVLGSAVVSKLQDRE